MCRAHARFEDLVRRLAGLQDRLTPWSGTVYRSSDLRYATNTDLLAGTGSSLYGGRWNPVRVETVYLSLTPETSMAETLAEFRRNEWDISDAMPRVFAAIRVELQKVLDLTDASIRRKLGLSLQALVGQDWEQTQASGTDALTQSLGRAAFAAGIEGLVVPSGASAGSRNLVVFPGNLSSGSVLAIHRPGELPGG